MTPYFLILALLLALAPAVIAHGKGRNFLFWWLYGVVLGPVALIHSILLRSVRRPVRESMPDERESWNSPWPLLLRVAASLAIAVVAVAIYRFFVPPEFEQEAGKPEIAISADRTPSAPSSPAPAPKTAPKTAAAPPKDAGETTAKAPDASELPKPPPSPTVPSPTVDVTVREDTPPSGTAAPDDTAAPKPPEPAARPAPEPKRESGQESGKAPDVAYVPPAPPPPPPSPAKSSGGQLERTAPLERTLAETPAPAPEKKKQDAVKEVDTLAARTAPPEEAGSAAPDPVIAPTPREDVLRRESDEQPARRKPATRKASAPKPAVAPPPPAPSDVTAVGDIVRVVQQALVERGYDPGPVNGRAGRQTEQAIRKFQQDRGLKTTGSIDYAVLETLNIVGPRIHAFQPPPGTTPGR